MTHPGGHSEEEFVVFKEQGVISSWMVLRLVDDQGEVSGIISLLVSTSLGFVFLCQQLSSGGGGAASCKNNLECVSGLYLDISGNREFG